MAFGLTMNSCSTTKDDELSSKSDINLIKLEDFFKNPILTQAKISPDGKHVAYLAPYETRLNVFIKRIEDGVETRLTSETARSVGGYFWKGSDRILFVKDSGGDENYRLFGIDINGQNIKGYTDFAKVKTEFIDDLPDDPRFIIIGLNKRNPQYFDAYRLNVVSGELKMIAENPGNISSWLTDHNGLLRVATTTDGVNTSLLYRDGEQDKFQTLYTTNFKESLLPAFFTFDNKNLYVLSNLNKDKTALAIFDVKKKNEIKILFQNPDYDLSGAHFSKKRKVLLDATYVSWKQERRFFDKKMKSIFNKIQKKLSGVEISISSKNKAEDKFVIRTYSDKTLGAYYIYDVSLDKLTLLAEVSPWLKESEMSDQKPIEYISRDGLKIRGYLTLPKGSSGKNVPIVVNPHGGPWYRDSWGFNPHVQFLASRGYGVFQMNFRGSTGYGRKFWEASFKEWGKKMQDDITDGVNFLIDQKIADKEKVAIFGGSYGGYATLAGLTFTPDLYACGVDFVGVSNLFTLLKTIPPYWKQMLDQFHEMIGHPETDKKLLEEASPVFHVDKIKVPLFIAQGANDPRVNKDESDQMVAALNKRGIKVEYMVKDNEGHGFKNEENRFDLYRAMESFLKKCL